jgi:hypothetical protein
MGALVCALGLGTANAVDYIYGGSSTSTHWTLASNWSTGVLPNSSDAWVKFGSEAAAVADRVNINFTSDYILPADSKTVNVGAVSILSDFDPTSSTFYIRNYYNTRGTMKFFGQSTTIGGESVTLLIGNETENADIYFNDVNGGYDMELQTSGVIYGAANTKTVIRNSVTEATGVSAAITKMGAGTLLFQNITSTTASDSSYTGGFILQEGVVEWTNSGDYTTSPFGSSAGGSFLQLSGGTLRSTDDYGRNVNVAVVLDGNTTLGSQDVSNNGFIQIQSNSGALKTTMLSDSTITTDSLVRWNQSIDAAGYTLTKEGEGTLRLFNGESDLALLHLKAGTTEAGVSEFSVRNAINGDVLVDDGATLMGDTDVRGVTTVKAGGVLNPYVSDELIEGYFGTETLTMEAGSELAFTIDSVDFANVVLDEDGVAASSIDGVTLSIELGIQPAFADEYLLIQNLGEGNIGGLFTYNSSTLENGDTFLVTTGEFSQYFKIDYAYDGGGYGNSIALIAVPEFSAWSLVSGSLAVTFVATKRRRRAK